jgi:hypothetical protein
MLKDRGYIPQDFTRTLALPVEDVIGMLDGEIPMPEKHIKKIFKRIRAEYFIKDRSAFN